MKKKWKNKLIWDRMRLFGWVKWKRRSSRRWRIKCKPNEKKECKYYPWKNWRQEPCRRNLRCCNIVIVTNDSIAWMHADGTKGERTLRGRRLMMGEELGIGNLSKQMRGYLMSGYLIFPSNIIKSLHSVLIFWIGSTHTYNFI